jgi:1-acyl-sn-glycerol-3-phosphate acyltransferase
LKKLLQILFTAWVAFWFIGLMLVLALFIALPLLHPKGFKLSYKVMQLWVWLLGKLCFIRFRIQGRENLAGGSPCIYAINHRSYMDAPAIPASIPEPLKALGKKELSYIPIFGQLVSGFAVWVDRSNPESRAKSLQRIKKVLEGGTPIVIAPEGTRNNTSELMLPFKLGAFRLAVETQTPIRPVIFIGTEQLMPRGTFLVKPGTIQTFILPPVDLNRTDTPEEYLLKVRKVMEEVLKEKLGI